VVKVLVTGQKAVTAESSRVPDQERTREPNMFDQIFKESGWGLQPVSASQEPLVIIVSRRPLITLAL